MWHNNRGFSCRVPHKCLAALPLQGLKLRQVPYILSLGLKRFEYDWERDARVKVDDRVEFPTELDMAQFLDLDEEEPAPVPAPVGEEGQEAGEAAEVTALPCLDGPDSRLIVTL